MARFLTTIPVNYGFYNLGTVQAYPTGGSGPTAYGPTTNFGSDPLPAQPGDSISTAIDLGNFSGIFKTLNINNTHGALTRKQTTFYKFRLTKARAIQFTQNYSQFSYTSNTNRNTLISFYKFEDTTKPIELPINDSGYVYKTSGIDYDDSDLVTTDYPNTRLEPGNYMFLITNDIRYLETTYSITFAVALTDWRYTTEEITDSIDFGAITETAETTLDFGKLAA